MRLRDIDLDLVRAFVEVADQGSFTAAAEVIGRTQSAVSQKLLRLEDALQMRLFDRTSRSLHLTNEGERVLAAGRRLLHHSDEFMRELRHPPEQMTLKLGFSENLLQTQLPHVLAGFSRLHPEIKLELTTGISAELLAAYKAQQLDVIIARTPSEGSPRRGRVVWREPLVWTVGTGFRDDGNAPARLVMLRPPCFYREAMIDALHSAGREWVTACTVTNLNGLRAAVVGGLGVSVVGKSHVHEGMRVISTCKRWPALPVAELSVLGETDRTREIVGSLKTLLTKAMSDEGTEKTAA